ncbi:hypothetical protein GOARA_076_00390 [Gordonia araii NBRC 100433]|uniref:ATP synthase protein I n=1 Tax=Gordonia araii NBRC 100433 TaxID=1073574 RepID=G7H6Q4_9ACTN|nr:hypothetical protein [Gordonia araii]NNG98617.1 hypothetical protein [Gordonia araii NBRC 100433]GAB11529.1 hypothetical protein GOARA_076_00390 [Gordonia araii NBRC 100433]
MADDNPDILRATTDPLGALKAGLRYGVFGLVALTVLGLAVWVPVAGTPGLWGVVVGAAVGGGFILVTILVVLATAHMPPTTSLYIIMGSWFLKMVAVIVVMAVIKNMDFYDRGALVSMLIGAIVIVLGAEFYGVLRTRVPYVDETPEK